MRACGSPGREDRRGLPRAPGTRGAGVAVGISSGANFLGAFAVGLELGDGAVVATVFADSNKTYLSTDLCREEPRRAGDLAPRIELGRVRTAPRPGNAFQVSPVLDLAR